MTAIDTSVPQLILRSAADTLSLTVYSDGVIADPGVTTIGVVTEDGTTIIAAGTATSGTGAAARTKALTSSDTAALGRWTVTWVTTNHGTLTTYAEVIGAHLFSIAEALSFDTMSAMSTAQPAAIAAARYRILEDFQAICGASFVPRWDRRVLDGTGNCKLFLPWLRVLSVIAIEYRERGAQTWTAFTADELADVVVTDTGAIERESLGVFTAGRRNWRVTYSYGWPAPPLPIQRAALQTAAYEMTQQQMNQRAISVTTPTGSEQLWTPGYSGRGLAIHMLPEVDRVLRLPEYNDRIPGIA